jgi:Zn-dependent peptidase ImmA (M78 family)/transcriptional regulator with XRE-family HTH domain
MSAEVVGRRIAEARGRAGMTQAQLAAATSLDRSALAKIETGGRGVSALELGRLAEALDTRIEWFLEDAPAAIISRRNAQEPGAPSPAIDAVIERLARNVEFTVAHDPRFRPEAPQVQPVPTSPDEAEALAQTARVTIGHDLSTPMINLAEKVAGLGLLAFCLELGIESADAATILLPEGGVAIVNGSLHTGRRRLALAHEWGHYLVADDFSMDWRVAEYQDSQRREYLLDRFARALLLPAAAVRAAWTDYTSGDGDLRTAAVRVASEYRVDMATLARRLTELDILGHADAGQVRAVRTTMADIVELDLVVGDELAPPTLPRPYERAVLRLYRGETISATRALDLLLDTWDEDALPELPKRSADAIWQYV